MDLLLLILSYMYLYNIFLFLPNKLLLNTNLNLKFVYLVIMQGIFISIVEKSRSKYGKAYTPLVLLILLPSFLVDIKLFLVEILFVYLWGYIGLDENSSFFVPFIFTAWCIITLLFLVILGP